jgi:hypothetical protein
MPVFTLSIYSSHCRTHTERAKRRKPSPQAPKRALACTSAGVPSPTTVGTPALEIIAMWGIESEFPGMGTYSREALDQHAEEAQSTLESAQSPVCAPPLSTRER